MFSLCTLYTNVHDVCYWMLLINSLGAYLLQIPKRAVGNYARGNTQSLIGCKCGRRYKTARIARAVFCTHCLATEWEIFIVQYRNKILFSGHLRSYDRPTNNFFCLLLKCALALPETT